MRLRILAAVLTLSFCAPATALANGGASFSEEQARANDSRRPTVPGTKAKLLRDGRAAAPEMAPPEVKRIIWWANRIIRRPYRYGGGHASVNDSGYDCSGTISYPLVKIGLLEQPLDSTGFMSWGERGRGEWVSIYANPGHAYMVVAGLRLDTSRAGDRRNQGRGPRWRSGRRSSRGFRVRHPAGL